MSVGDARLCALERLRQVVDEVLAVLDADGQADETVVDPEEAARLGRDRGMRHDRGVLDE